MPRRKSPYPDSPYTMRPEIKHRFEVLMKPEKKVQEKWVPKGGWQLWRWDTLEDVPQWISK